MEANPRPRLIFFQARSSQNLPRFLLLHRQEHVKCLAEFFEVIVISEDCDYQQICDKYQPDLTLFENPGNNLDCHRPRIINTHTHPQVPKLGLLNADAWCNSRAVFFSDMERWGVETFFSICLTAAEHTPEIADRLFVWPNFIDPSLYRDYQQSKVIPVLLSGANNALYPWRQRVSQRIAANYPVLSCPHLGYDSRRTTDRMIYGEAYARMINASWFVPTCGTVAREIVRKHFEIPAARACLITERSLALEAAGFVDMENCVFADEPDVLDKLDYLFQHREQLEQIIQAGHQLTHTRHTLRQRSQIWEWYNLNRTRGPNQVIVQTGPFQPLQLVEVTSGAQHTHIYCQGLSITLIHQGDQALAARRYDQAESLYLQCLHHAGIMHEPKLRLAICYLLCGRADQALEWLVPLNRCVLDIYKAADPDPVEWAYLLLALVCKGDLAAAQHQSGEYPNLCHPELDRARWAIKLLTGVEPSLPLASGQVDGLPRPRPSVHHLPKRDVDQWLTDFARMLIACDQKALASRLVAVTALLPEDLATYKASRVGQPWSLRVRVSRSRLSLPETPSQLLSRVGRKVIHQVTGRVMPRFSGFSAPGLAARQPSLPRFGLLFALVYAPELRERIQMLLKKLFS